MKKELRPIKTLFFLFTFWGILACGAFLFSNCQNKSNFVAVDSLANVSSVNKTEEWEKWLNENWKEHLFLSEDVKPEHVRVINNLLTIFYSGDKSKKDDVDMIRWVLEKYLHFDDTGDEVKQYENLEKQLSSLLDFEVINNYQIKRKSALTRLINNYKIKLYEKKLMESIHEPEIKVLLEKDISTWNSYFEATSDAYGKVILGRESYNFKYVVWNEYDFEIMKERYNSLVCIYLKDYSVWNESTECRWDEVGYSYDKIQKLIESSQETEYNYSQNEQIEALFEDKDLYKAFLNAHFELAAKLNMNDENYLLHSKTNIIDKYFLGDGPDFSAFDY